MTLFETSALTGESISLMFQTVAEQLYHASGIYSPEKHLSKANSELRVPAVTDKEDSWNCCRVQ
ncbi:hypothetical protein MHBO_000091 [Bonamia ostreae]|uniref:Uncharacterized protein n=1 Tax=Bonamia ostreae TaxID=126728 RepID=A0ABV2AFC0_9EUKA